MGDAGGVEDRALAAQHFQILQADRSGDLHPVLGFQVLVLGAGAEHAEKGGVLSAADHAEPAGGVHPPGELGRLGYDAAEFHRLALVALGIVHAVGVPEAVVVIAQLQHRYGQVEGTQAIVVVLHPVVGVLQVHLRPAVEHFQVALTQDLRQLVSAAVKDDQIGLPELLHHQAGHVFGVAVEGGGLHNGDDLVQVPVPGEGGHGLGDLPHAVVLHHDLGGMVLRLQGLHFGQVQVLLALQVDGDHVKLAQGRVVIFLLTLLADQEEGALILGEIRAGEHGSDKIRLACVQKAADHIDGNGFLCHSQLPHICKIGHGTDYRQNNC